MKDIQLSILLDKYSDLLWNAYWKMTEELPEDCAKTRKNLLGGTDMTYPILEPLTDVITNLDEDVELLRKNIQEK